MNRQYLRNLRKSEEARVINAINSQKAQDVSDVDLASIFRNNVVYKTITEGQNPLLNGFDQDVLPSISMFYDHILVQICPTCACAEEPSLIEPYLEKGLVIPLLPGGYDTYPPNFVGVILQHPHISAAEYRTYRKFSLFQHESTYTCTSCNARLIQDCMSAAKRRFNKSRAPDKAKNEMRRDISTALIDADPFLSPERMLVDEMKERLTNHPFTNEDAKGIVRVLSLIRSVGIFRTAEAYSAVPQLSLSKPEIVARASKLKPGLVGPYDTIDVRDSVLNGLKLSYSPSIPIETYFDIIQSRRRTISRIVTDMMARSKPASKEFLGNLQKEIDQINDEVREITTSKRAKVWGFVTSFLSQNKEIIAGCLSGAILGSQELGIIGCASGSIAGSLGLGALKRQRQIKMPAETTGLKRAISSSVDPSIARLLAFYLSKELRAIQVWQLQRKIMG